MLLDLIPWKKPDIGRMRQERDVSGLIRALACRDPDIQSGAVHALGEIGQGAAGQILPLLKRKNRNLRLGAIGALAGIRDPAAIPALADMMEDPVTEIRWQAAVALGEMDSGDAIAPLLRGLKDPDKYVRYGSAVSLGRNGYEPPDESSRAGYYAAMQDWERLKETGPAAAGPLTNLLRDTDSSVRAHAVRILADTGDDASGPAIIRMLADPDRQVRWEATLASGKLGVPPLILPRGLYRRPRIQKNPLVAGFLNFLLPGLGYGYLGKWWGIMIFQVDITVTVWTFKEMGESNTYGLLLPVYFLLAIHAWYLAKNMPEEPA
jgi:HEAT repeat protein